jgi:hypothetical protein
MSFQELFYLLAQKRIVDCKCRINLEKKQEGIEMQFDNYI